MVIWSSQVAENCYHQLGRCNATCLFHSYEFKMGYFTLQEVSRVRAEAGRANAQLSGCL